jgi:hypothetical protein
MFGLGRKPKSLFQEVQTGYFTRTSRALNEVIPKIDFELKKAGRQGRVSVYLNYHRMTDVILSEEISAAIKGHYEGQGFKVQIDRLGISIRWD